MNESCFLGIFAGGKAAVGPEAEKDWGRSDTTAKLCTASKPHSIFPSEVNFFLYFYNTLLFCFIYPPDAVWEKSRVGQTAIWMDVTDDLSVQQTHARSLSWAWKSSRGNPTPIGRIHHSNQSVIFIVCIFFFYLYIFLLVFCFLFCFFIILCFSYV